MKESGWGKGELRTLDLGLCLAPQAYLTHFFLQYAGQRTLGTFLLGILLMLDIMILIYFSRLLRSDFCPEPVPSPQHKDKFLTE